MYCCLLQGIALSLAQVKAISLCSHVTSKIRWRCPPHFPCATSSLTSSSLSWPIFPWILAIDDRRVAMTIGEPRRCDCPAWIEIWRTRPSRDNCIVALQRHHLDQSVPGDKHRRCIYTTARYGTGSVKLGDATDDASCQSTMSTSEGDATSAYCGCLRISISP